MRHFYLISAGLAASLASALAQVPDQAAPSSPAPATASSSSGSTSSGPASSPLFSKDLPSFNPGNEILSFDGKNWNINDNRVFQARFEKYLNAPEETSENDRNYQAVVGTILDKLAPGKTTPATIDEAFSLLPKASDYEIDAHLCDALADAVYSVWLSKKEDARLSRANTALEKERQTHEWNARLSSQEPATDTVPRDPAAAAEWRKNQQAKRDAKLAPYTTRLADVNAMIVANRTKRELTQLQAKVEFQSLILQFFLQRRFQHVLMATRFYRNVFSDGDTLVRVEGDAKKLFTGTTGMPPTVGILDSLANEAIRDSREGVQAYEYLLEKDELNSATKRLAETFVVGEYLPELRTLSRDKKRKALVFAQKSNQLISAIEVKDYTLAEKLVHDLEATAKDFDNSKPMAAIETAKSISDLHLAKAKNAAVSGDQTTLETELKAAYEIWPRNPAAKEVSTLIFGQANVQQKAILDFDQLYSQKNYRQIFDDQARFIAALSLSPDRQGNLKTVLESMQQIEAAIMRSNEIAKRRDYAGAWESVERVCQQFPDDSKLNQLRANLTIQASDFVRTLKRAEKLEEQNQTGSSMSWYLKAQNLYQGSEFAEEGIKRLIKKILPSEESQPGTIQN